MRLLSKDAVKVLDNRIGVLITQYDLKRRMKAQKDKYFELNFEFESDSNHRAINILQMSNGMKVFDFDEDVILEKLEKLMARLDNEF